ncbi:hypothetical protein [Gryllotalpicola protaetiae]|uniref:Uncharacterized protein n=1 Tax=Gryllotalpicola protaetiae TaxID=2419771 RepID=A0A387BL70_9MICO|nr:hypothetical protein [Gryllotalpicola protaetiae]AYG03408.1 hypothetical protein D7I44_07585 [Gryllotalpicola protaetiae]
MSSKTLNTAPFDRWAEEDCDLIHSIRYQLKSTGSVSAIIHVREAWHQLAEGQLACGVSLEIGTVDVYPDDDFEAQVNATPEELAEKFFGLAAEPVGDRIVTYRQDFDETAGRLEYDLLLRVKPLD